MQDLSHTVSESLGDYLQKWGIPAIPRPRINTAFPKRQNVDSSKLKEFAEDNFRIIENGRKFFKRVENTVRKGEIACYEQFLLFSQCFQKTCAAET